MSHLHIIAEAHCLKVWPSAELGFVDRNSEAEKSVRVPVQPLIPQVSPYLGDECVGLAIAFWEGSHPSVREPNRMAVCNECYKQNDMSERGIVRG